MRCISISWQGKFVWWNWLGNHGDGRVLGLLRSRRRCCWAMKSEIRTSPPLLSCRHEIDYIILAEALVIKRGWGNELVIVSMDHKTKDSHAHSELSAYFTTWDTHSSPRTLKMLFTADHGNMITWKCCNGSIVLCCSVQKPTTILATTKRDHKGTEKKKMWFSVHWTLLPNFRRRWLRNVIHSGLLFRDNSLHSSERLKWQSETTEGHS